LITRADVEVTIEDNRNERSELLEQIDFLDRVHAELKLRLSEFCGATCDHGGGCNLPRNHDPSDRHHSGHCVFYDAAPAAKPRRCPTCDSHNPAIHPAVQLGGEVQYCSDPWHGEHAAKPTPDAKCGTCGGSSVDPSLSCAPCPKCGGTGVRK
jgi:hypothetical protein